MTCAGIVSQGDWGTQFGMLIQFLAEARPDGLADPTIADLALPELQVCVSVLHLVRLKHVTQHFMGSSFENLQSCHHLWADAMQML